MRKLVQKYQNIFFSKFVREHFQKIGLLDNICLLGHLASFYLSTLGISLGQFSDKGKLGIGGYFFVIFSFWRILFCSIIFYCEAQQIPVGQKLHRCVS